MTAFLFSVLFVGALLLTTLVKLWLARRHLAHIATHRAKCRRLPRTDRSCRAPKGSRLHQRQDALCHAGALFDAALLLVLTLGGGNTVDRRFLAAYFCRPHRARHVRHRVGADTLRLLETPFDLYRTFVIEARFGFNKMTLKLYLVDALKSLLLGAVIGLPLLFGVLWLMATHGS